MPFEILVTDNFADELAKQYKKFPSILNDIEAFKEELQEYFLAPKKKDMVYSNTYKIRMSITDNRKGKSGGARILVYAVMQKNTLHLLDMFTKSEMDNVSDSYIKSILKEAGLK